MKALILAGGKGTRMGDLTKTIQKTMIDLNGKPVLQHQIEFLKKNGITDILLSVGYLKEQIIDFFEDGSRFGVKIGYIIEEEPLGTAGPLKLAKEKLKETFVMVNGDTLTNAKIPDLVNFHKKEKSLTTIMLIHSDETKSRGMVKMKGNKIMEFVEKPDKDTKSLINGGWYVIEPSVIDMVADGYCMLEKEIFPKLAAEGKLSGWQTKAKILDMGTPERLEKALKEWKPQV